MENSGRDGNTRPPDLPLEKPIAGQEATVRTGHGTTDWFQISKGVRQGCILSLCLFNLYAEYIIRSAGLDEVQATIKIAGRNINNINIRDTKGIFHTKMGSMKDRNGMDITEAEDIRRGGKNTWKNCTKKIFMTKIIMML